MGRHKVKIEPEGTEFTVAEGEIVLDAALQQGIPIMHSCRNGTCRTCLFQVVKGSLQQENVESCMIAEQELEAGLRLLCMSTLSGDAVIEKPQRRKRK